MNKTGRKAMCQAYNQSQQDNGSLTFPHKTTGTRKVEDWTTHFPARSRGQMDSLERKPVLRETLMTHENQWRCYKKRRWLVGSWKAFLSFSCIRKLEILIRWDWNCANNLQTLLVYLKQFSFGPIVFCFFLNAVFLRFCYELQWWNK
jgi:hypothetical protein